MAQWLPERFGLNKDGLKYWRNVCANLTQVSTIVVPGLNFWSPQEGSILCYHM